MKPILLLTLAALITLSACRKEPTKDIEKPQPAITLQFNVPESTIVETKVQSASESAINSAWVFVFNSAGVFQTKHKALNINNTTRTASISMSTGYGVNLYVCANASAAQEAIFSSMVKDGMTIANFKAITTDRSSLNAPGLPMWGELLNQTITAATTSIAMTMTRNSSRLDVVASWIADFTFLGIQKLLKTAPSAPIFPAASLVAASSTIDVVPANNSLNSIYLYENEIVAADEATAESKATAVIIKGTYKGITGYYKLRIRYGWPFKHSIGRNIIYSINIAGVKSPGFATLAEAEANYPQNVDYNVVISDGVLTDLVTSNGQYYLGVSNSEYVRYDNSALTNVVVTTVTHNAPLTVSNGTVTATGAGLILKTTTIDVASKKQNIVVDMASNFSSGTLTLRLGNLMKVVNVSRKASLPSVGGVNSDFAAASYISGDVITTTPWFKFGENVGYTGLASSVYNPNGGIYMHIDPYYTVPTVDHYCSAYVMSADSKGRTRIDAKQTSAVLEYTGGIPTTKIVAIFPLDFLVKAKTDMPGWTVKAYEGAKDVKTKPIALTFTPESQTGEINLPKEKSKAIVLPNNTGAERTIQLYLSAAEFPYLEIWCGSVVQDNPSTLISISSYSQSGIPRSGGSYQITLTSYGNWITGGASFGSFTTPYEGGSGTFNVRIDVSSNPDTKPRVIRLIFSVAGNFSEQVTWLGYQAGA